MQTGLNSRRELGARIGVPVMVLCVLASWGLPPAARAASVAITPSDVTLTPGARASGLLLLANSDARRMSVRVRANENDGSLEATVRTRRVEVAPKGSVAVPFTVRRALEGGGQDSGVQFLATFTESREQPSANPEAVVATLRVKAAASPALIEATIESKVSAINENRPGSAALILTNPREQDVRVSEMSVSAPDATDVGIVCSQGRKLIVAGGTVLTTRACAVDIPPRSQEVLPLTFDSADSVAPGPRTVLVKVTARRSARASQSVVASTAFTVDVFAESDILKAIGVPVFLLLPGVVIVLTAWFLIKRLSPWRQVAGDVALGTVVSAATATALLGLAISLVVALLYPQLTGAFIPGYERDYLRAYGFRDFYYVIGYSFAIATLVWALASGGFLLVRWLLLPWPRDEAGSLLRKIGIRGLIGGRTTFPRVTVDQNDRGLQLSRRSAGRALVAPRITVQITGAADGLPSRIEEAASGGRAFELWRTVDAAVRRRQATIGYRNGGEPQLLDRATLIVAPGEIPIVEVASDE